jgi:hypothetical protein
MCIGTLGEQIVDRRCQLPDTRGAHHLHQTIRL